MNHFEVTPEAQSASATKLVSEYFDGAGELVDTKTGYAIAPVEVMSPATLVELAGGTFPSGDGNVAIHITPTGELITGTLTNTGAIISTDFSDGDRQVITLSVYTELQAAA